jgi:hypothetical protein
VSAQDAVGNVEPASATTLAIDRSVPVVSIACDGGACSSALTDRATEVSLSATAGASGVAQIRYTLDGSDPTAGLVYAGPFVLSTTTTRELHRDQRRRRDIRRRLAAAADR